MIKDFLSSFKYIFEGFYIVVNGKEIFRYSFISNDFDLDDYLIGKNRPADKIKALICARMFSLVHEDVCVRSACSVMFTYKAVEFKNNSLVKASVSQLKNVLSK